MLNIIKDWDLIEASFQLDYNIDLTKENMSYRRFNLLLNSLSSDSPLGNIIKIRTYEKPNKDIKQETKKQQIKMTALKNKYKLREE